jgi:hypothetical protein
MSVTSAPMKQTIGIGTSIGWMDVLRSAVVASLAPLSLYVVTGGLIHALNFVGQPSGGSEAPDRQMLLSINSLGRKSPRSRKQPGTSKDITGPQEEQAGRPNDHTMGTP